MNEQKCIIAVSEVNYFFKIYFDRLSAWLKYKSYVEELRVMLMCKSEGICSVQILNTFLVSQIIWISVKKRSLSQMELMQCDMSGFWYRQILYTACCIRFILDRRSFYAEIQIIFRDSVLKIVILSSLDSEAESNPLLTGKFLSWILMKIGECVRLGVRRKVIKGFFERKKFLGSYLSFKICQIFFRICTLHFFLFINKFFLILYCLL